MGNWYGRKLDELQRALDAFDAWFQEAQPDLYPRLRPGLSSEEIRLLEARLDPYRLPEDLVVLYSWHDGWDATANGEHVNLLPSGRFCSLRDAVEQYAQWCSLSEEHEDTWNPLWFPAFGSSNGEFVELHELPGKAAGELWSAGVLWSFDSHDAVVWTSYDSVASMFRATYTLWRRELMPFEGEYPDGLLGWAAGYNRRTQRPGVVVIGSGGPEPASVTGPEYKELSRFPSLDEWPATWLVAAGLEPPPADEGDSITVATQLESEGLMGGSERQVFDGVLGVLDGQFCIASDADDIGPDMFAAFVGQRNGLLGAAEEGQLRLITGKADGDVAIAVHVVESEPDLDDSWEDCVEVSFSPRTPAVGFFDWDFNVVFKIPLAAQTYRVRYAGRAMDAGHAGTQMDTYALWFWPASAAPDAIVKQTSESAAYWHTEMARVSQYVDGDPRSS